MHTILCFGDSNTFGYRPTDRGRYSKKERWTGILADKGKKDWEIIEEGLVGRTSIFEDRTRPGRKGSDYLIPLLETHAPVEQLVLMLGTNDCKTFYGATPETIGKGIELLIRQAKEYNPDLGILLVSPILLGENVWKEDFDPEFDRESVKTSRELKWVYKRIAGDYQCRFLAAEDYANPSGEDQEHLTNTHGQARGVVLQPRVSSLSEAYRLNYVKRE